PLEGPGLLIKVSLERIGYLCGDAPHGAGGGARSSMTTATCSVISRNALDCAPHGCSARSWSREATHGRHAAKRLFGSRRAFGRVSVTKSSRGPGVLRASTPPPH